MKDTPSPQPSPQGEGAWYVPHACMVRAGGWADMGLTAETTATTLQVRDRHGTLVLVIGSTAAEVFKIIGDPPRLRPDLKRD